MNQKERVAYLLDYFLSENPEHQNIQVPPTLEEQKLLLRGLLNLRHPMPLSDEILAMEDAYLAEEQGEIVHLEDLTPVKPGLYLWQGDITTLAVDAIVNAANNALLGCFYPNHGCIDNIIHTKAGVRLRLACQELMEKQGRPEATGTAKITSGYNLPSKWVIHTVGPIVSGDLEQFHRDHLKNCYLSCLELAVKEGVRSLAFCCISTGEFRFPQEEACDIAVSTVEGFLAEHPDKIQVIFNVFQDKDCELYGQRLS